MFKFILNLIICINYGYSFNLSPIPNFKLVEPNLKFHINKTESSYFGYTINFRKNSIIIGAPRAQSTLDSQRHINETGAIYKCDLNTENCAPFIFDHTGNVNDTMSSIYYGSLIKEKQWLGAAIDGHSSDSDHLIVCAPNIVTAVYPDHYLFHGVCYITSNTFSYKATDLKILAPLRLKRKQNLLIQNNINLQLYMFGQFGLSVHITDHSEQILIGAPGVFMWKGTVARYKPVEIVDFPKLSKRDLHDIYQLPKEIDFESEIANPNFWQQKDNSYFGYAITSANFNDESSSTLPEILYVASAPQGNFQMGEVIIFDFAVIKQYSRDPNERSIHIYRTFYGQQMGEYFGYALMVDDFNGDGLTDLVIAAPFYGKSSDAYDNGRVYVYLNKGFLSFSESINLMSDYELSGRFGMTLGKIGDINRDGFKDIAIGAPFEENGVVYIYIGGPNGLSKTPSQKIVAPLNEHTSLPHYFGHGLSKGVDYDLNGFNDFCIGAPNIDTVYVYKSYPVVKIIATITPESPSLDIDEKSSKITVCLRYDSVVELKFNVVEILITVKLDPKLNRAKLKSDGTNQFNRNLLINSYEQCFDFDINLQYVLGDIFKPVVLEVHYKIVKKFEESTNFCNDCVAINPNDPTLATNKIVFSTGCKNLHCLADLKIQSNILTPIPYILGSSKSLSINYTIENFGETAYSVEIIVKLLSKSATFNRVPSNCKLVDGTLFCNAAQGKPLYDSRLALNNNPPINFSLSIDTSKLEGDALTVNTTVTSSGDEDNQSDNICLDIIRLAEFSDVEIIGKSSEPELSVEETGLILQNIVHSYQIRNMGPSNIKKMLFTISMPIIFVNKTIQNQISLIKFNEINIRGVYDNTEIKSKWSKNDGDLLNVNSYDKVDGNEKDEKIILADKIDLVERRSIYSYNRYTEETIEHHNRSRRSVSNEFDESVINLPQNRLFYFNCSAKHGREHFCVHAIFEIRNFLAGDKIANIKINFTIDLALIDKLYTVDRDIFLMYITSKVERVDDIIGNTIKAVIIDPYTIITKYVMKSTPIWIIILSVLAGLLLLVGVSYGLYKAGFFKRTKKRELVKLKRQSVIQREMQNFDLLESEDE